MDVAVEDALAPSHLSQDSLCNPATTATEGEARKSGKYRELIDNGNNFQSVAKKEQISLGESSETGLFNSCPVFEATDLNGS